ncbi:MADF domain [Cinara cedri]|uniref:MADF domain n=1 Tax=Cinara cedri TaxID=506608 RepID=A0A5E4N236_9HEMI|nr:MADF domain [Cinara cedri]
MCKDCTNREKNNEQYDVLVEKYREYFPDADKQEVIKKVNYLRTNFRKELKSIRDAEKSGTGTEDIKPSL